MSFALITIPLSEAIVGRGVQSHVCSIAHRESLIRAMLVGMPAHAYDPAVPDEAAQLKTGALQSAIFNGANFSQGPCPPSFSELGRAAGPLTDDLTIAVLRHSGPSPTTAHGE